VLHACTLQDRAAAEHFVDATAGPVNDEGGERLGAVLVLRDAAPRLAQEALLRASETRFRNAFDFAPLGMALVSLAGEFIQVNDAMCTLLGRSRAELASLAHTALGHPADRAHEVQRLHDLAAASTGVVQFEKRYLRGAAAEPVWTLVSVSMLRHEGHDACHLYQVHDLTEQKRAAERLAELADERILREASELASAAKTEFLSRVSHEMRTPLNAVIGFAQLLQLQKLPDAQGVSEYAKLIHDAGAHLLTLVTDLLDLNQAAQGTLKLQSAPVPLAKLVDEALNLLRGEAAAHGIGIETSVPSGLCVLADAQRLRQVLLNIVSNAIKYNRQGGAVRLAAARLDQGSVRLTIEDHGIGMTPQQLERLFNPFDRLGAEQTKVPGTGLGLVIARSLVHEMGGTLRVQSTSRSGTTVTIELRAAP
jgi:PAS domain S-box-containing protein